MNEAAGQAVCLSGGLIGLYLHKKAAVLQWNHLSYEEAAAVKGYKIAVLDIPYPRDWVAL